MSNDILSLCMCVWDFCWRYIFRNSFGNSWNSNDFCEMKWSSKNVFSLKWAQYPFSTIIVLKIKHVKSFGYPKNPIKYQKLIFFFVKYDNDLEFINWQRFWHTSRTICWWTLVSVPHSLSLSISRPAQLTQLQPTRHHHCCRANVIFHLMLK